MYSALFGSASGVKPSLKNAWPSISSSVGRLAGSGCSIACTRAMALCSDEWEPPVCRKVPVAYLVVSRRLHHPPNAKQVAAVSFGHSLGTAASVPAALLAHACDMLRSDGKLYLFCRMSLHVFLTLLVSNGGLPTSIVYLQVPGDPSYCLYLAFTRACATVQRQGSQHVRH
jgi:hypothetical protein